MSPSAEARRGLQPCRLTGLENSAWCGRVHRPLDPSRPSGPQIDVAFAVLPALARNALPDPVFFLAGGPGQSAIDLAPSVASLLTRLGNRRDVVLMDQRGTGRSAPLLCAEESPTAPLAQSLDPAASLARIEGCKAHLQTLPHGDLRFYTTWIAVQDLDAVRQALGAERVDLIGGSYGTRAALEYMRQFPGAVRRVVIDGVAPPDMALPRSFSTDNQAALDAVFEACEAAPACRMRYPALREDWRRLLARMPRTVQVAHPVTGTSETVRLTRDALLSAVRAPLYAPWVASGLPAAIEAAVDGRFGPLLALSAATSSSRSPRLAEGMHFSVVCSEDAPRMAGATDAPGADFADTFAEQYRQVCADWPRGVVPDTFYKIASAPAATLVLSGGADPVTPPRHGARVAAALGPKARHVVVPQAGHGVMSLTCMRDVIYRFINAENDADALKVDADCAARMPRPPAFVPISASAASPVPSASAAGVRR